MNLYHIYSYIDNKTDTLYSGLCNSVYLVVCNLFNVYMHVCMHASMMKYK